MMGTNKDLLMLNDELGQLPTILKIFLKSKIAEFHNNNSIRLNTLHEKINILQKEFLEFENDRIKFTGEGADIKPVMKEGKTKEDLDKSYAELMEREVNIII